jgi:carbamoyl-phosphate synthase small subunit
MDEILNEPTAKIILADGTRYWGHLVGGGTAPVWGEVVFNTSMTGYQEVITDPSYAGQIIVMTYPQIGNYGVTYSDSERATCAARALVVRELSPFFSPGPNRISLEQFMKEQGLVGITGVDTRAITRKIRSGGAAIAAIGRVVDSDDMLLDMARSKSLGREEALVASVSGSLNGTRPGSAGRVAVIDLGIKKSILDNVHLLGATTEVFDTFFQAADIIAGEFDFVVVSNGPGNPTDIPDVVDQIGKLVGKVPMLGICLGHQIIALAMGGTTYKLKFGHHGANQPVIDKESGRVFITSQNHGFAVSDDIVSRTGAAVTYTNANDGTLEGFVDHNRFVECVQFHPEASPGPHDTRFVFEQFSKRAKGWRDAAAA